MKTYLVLITWANGVEGLLFPRPGNVEVADTLEKGNLDFYTAIEHLKEYVGERFPDSGQKITLRLIEFERGNTLQEFSLLT